MNVLEAINSKWKYKSDKYESWQVKPMDDLSGDCEDYSLTVLFHDICKSSKLEFLKNDTYR